MTDNKSPSPQGPGRSERSAERARRASGAERSAPPPAHLKRWWPQHKIEVVLRLLQGESLDALAREVGKPASELASWRAEFLQGGEAALKARTKAETDAVGDAERQRLQAKVGELSMDNELLREKIRGLEKNCPPVWRKSR